MSPLEMPAAGLDTNTGSVSRKLPTHSCNSVMASHISWKGFPSFWLSLANTGVAIRAITRITDKNIGIAFFFIVASLEFTFYISSPLFTYGRCTGNNKPTLPCLIYNLAVSSEVSAQPVSMPTGNKATISNTAIQSLPTTLPLRHYWLV